MGQDGPFVAPGTYLLTFSGSGKLSFEGDARLVSSTSTSATFSVVNPGGCLNFKFEWTARGA